MRTIRQIIAILIIALALSYLFSTEARSYPGLVLTPGVYFAFLSSLLATLYLIRFSSYGLWEVLGKLETGIKSYPVFSGLIFGFFLCGLLFSHRYHYHQETVQIGTGFVLVPVRYDFLLKQYEWVKPSLNPSSSQWSAFHPEDWRVNRDGSLSKNDYNSLTPFPLER